MKIETLKPENEADWLDMRRNDITSTQASALFDLSPYNTKFELYHAKKDGLELEFKVNDRMLKGNRMERYAAEEIAIEHGFTDLRHVTEYVRAPELRIGSSFDYECKHPDKGLGGLELKAVEYAQYKAKWADGEIPTHIEVQCQHQFMLKPEWKWLAIGVHYTLYDHDIIYIERDEDFIQGLKDAIAEFWIDVENSNEPKPDYGRDSDVIKALYKGGDDYKDYTENEHLEMLCGKIIRLKDEEKYIKSEIKAAQAEIIDTLDNSKGGYTNAHKISVTQIADSADKVITKDMVGNVTKGRKGYLKLNVKGNK